MAREEGRRPDDNSPETEVLLGLARGGDREAIGRLFERHRERLARAVELRMHPAVRARLGVDDVLQQGFVEALGGLERFLEREHSSVFLWLRRIVLRALTAIHREHLGAQARDARRELRFDSGCAVDSTSACLVESLAGTLSSPSKAAMRAERKRAVTSALSRLDEADREILALRHFEQLSNVEAAEVLALELSAASKRHLRALRRLRAHVLAFESNVS